MKKRVLLLLPLLVLGAIPLFSTRMVTSEHFSIVYEEQSENIAARIFSRAEDMYSSLVTLFGADPGLFIPVYIETEAKSYNAYSSQYPSNHIVLYDTALIPELAVFSESYEMTFFHELVHAFTFGFKGPLAKVTTFLFGDSFNGPPTLHMMYFLQEGISVYSESREGEGRLNSALSLLPLREAVMEGVDIPYQAASGARHRYPSGAMGYIFGGAFLDWVAHEYGEDVLYSFFVDLSTKLLQSVKSSYRRRTGHELVSDWERFLSSVDVPSSYSESRTVFESSTTYSPLTASGGRIYSVENSSETLFSFSPTSGRTDHFRFYSYAYSSSVSSDGRILVTYTSDNVTRVGVLIPSGKVEKTWKDAYGGSFVTINGEEHVVLRKNRDGHDILSLVTMEGEELLDITLPENMMAGLLSKGDDGILWALVYDGGKGRIVRFTLPEGRADVYAADDIDVESVSYTDGVLSFSYTSSSTLLPRYGEIDTESAVMKLSSLDFLGGVSYPVTVGDTAYYISSYFTHSAISKEPRDFLLEGAEERTVDLVPFRLSWEERDLEALRAESKAYRPYLNLMKGGFLPLATDLPYATDDIPLGFLWITGDYTGKHIATIGAGYSPMSGSMSASLDYTYGNAISLSLSALTDRGELVSLSASAGADLSIGLSHMGENILLSGTLGWRYNNASGEAWANSFSVTYTNTRQKAMGRDHIGGFDVSALWDGGGPVLSATAYIPSLLKWQKLSSLDWGTPVSVSLSYGFRFSDITVKGEARPLSISLDRPIPFLSLYISHINLRLTGDAVLYVGKEDVTTTAVIAIDTYLSPVVGRLSSLLLVLQSELFFYRSEKPVFRINFDLR